MADYSFAPPGGLRGFLGAYNFGLDTENNLQNMFQRKEQHDLSQLRNRLDYDIRRRDEEVVGDVKRNLEKDKNLSEQGLIPWKEEETRARAGLAVSQADIENRKIELERKQSRMDAVESAYEYLMNRGGENGTITPPSPLDKSYDQIKEILRSGQWNDSEFMDKDPVSLVAWLQEGHAAAQTDSKRLAERRKQLHELEKARTVKSDSAPRKYSTSMELANLLALPSWTPGQQESARMLFEMEVNKIREREIEKLQALREMGANKYSDEEILKRANLRARAAQEVSFPTIYRRLGITSEGPPTVESPQTMKEPTESKATDPKQEQLVEQAKRIMAAVAAGKKVDPRYVERAQEILRSASGQIR